MAKLWQKENQSTDAKIEKFTIGNDAAYDLLLARYDVIGSLAHIKMLASDSVNLLSHSDQATLEKELKKILVDIEAGTFRSMKEWRMSTPK